MSNKTTWSAILQRGMAMAEGRHMRVRSGMCTLLLERRGDVLVALRELSRDEAQPAAVPAGATGPAPRQLLKIGEVCYLCDWRRQPAEASWLAAFAGTQP